MKTTVVIGTSYGDEAKAALTAELCRDADMCVRFSGGNNTGATFYDNQGRKHVAHSVPVGVLNPKCLNVIAGGCYIDPVELEKEIEYFKDQFLTIQLAIYDNCHVITEKHKNEDKSDLSVKIGTTGRGVGYAARDKYTRSGVQFIDWLNDNLHSPLRKYLTDHRHGLVNSYCLDNLKVVLEGTQGTLLDVDHGNYPFVTSSNCVSAAAALGSGIPPNFLKDRIGVLKAYQTRVGNGPFDSEILGPEADALVEIGKEYGATTGRRRRVGWLNLDELRYSHQLNDYTKLFVSKLDVLDSFEKIGLYENGQFFEIDGWLEDTTDKTSIRELPQKAKNFLFIIENSVDVPIYYVGVGPNKIIRAFERWC